MEHKLIEAYAHIVRKEFSEAFLKERGRCQHVIVIGSIGSGKSTSLEDFVELRYGKGDLILDLFDAGDFENCFYAVKRKNRFPILLLHPSDVKVKSRDGYVKPASVDGVALKPLLTQAKKENRIVCFVPGLFRDDSKMFKKIADIAWNIHGINFVLGYNVTIVLREAANIVYSSLKTTELREQLEAKRALIRLMRVGRHYGIRFLIDTQRFQDVAPCFRENPFWIVIKRMWAENLPRQLSWLPSSVKKVLPKLGNNQAVVVSPSNTYIFWEFPLPSFHHKEPHDRLTDFVNIEMEWRNIQPKYESTSEMRRIRLAIEGLEKIEWKHSEIAELFGYKSRSAIANIKKRYNL